MTETSIKAIDHHAEALRLLEAADNWDSSNPEDMPHVMEMLARAQIHASLAGAGPVARENVAYIVVGPDQDEGGLTTLGRPTYDRSEADRQAHEMNARWARHGGWSQDETGRPWKLCALVEVDR
jgi:hypothetical protein